MSKLDQITKGDRITFSLVRAGIAGDTFINVLVDSGTTGYGTARLISTDLNNKHANLYAFFKEKVNNINDPSAYDYIVIKPNDLKEEYIAIGKPWINEDSIVTSQTNNVIVELYNFEEFKRPSLETLLKNANISYAFSDYITK